MRRWWARRLWLRLHPGRWTQAEMDELKRRAKARHDAIDWA